MKAPPSNTTIRLWVKKGYRDELAKCPLLSGPLRVQGVGENEGVWAHLGQKYRVPKKPRFGKRKNRPKPSGVDDETQEDHGPNQGLPGHVGALRPKSLGFCVGFCLVFVVFVVFLWFFCGFCMVFEVKIGWGADLKSKK